MMLNDDPNDGWGNTNWIDKTFGTGSNTQHSITATGGSEKITYFTSIGYLNQKGNIKNFDFERFNLRGNLESKIAKNLTLTFGIAGQIGNRTASAYGAGGSSDSATPAWAVPWLSVAEQAIYSHPYLPMEMNGLPVASAHHPVNNQPVNPIAATERSGLFKNNSTDIQSNLALKWDIPWVDGLSLKVVGGYDCSFTFAKNFSTPYKVMRENYMLGTYTEMLDARNYKDPRLTEASTRWNKINSQASINYENTFGKHSVAGTVLVETRQYKTNYLNATKEGFAFPQIPEIDNGLKPFDGAPMAGNSSQTRYAGFVARFNYDYDQRYLVEVSGRLDGGWKFIGNSPEYRWGTFPGASVGWRMSNEDFFEGLRSVVDNLKIRASYGQLGSDGGVANYAFLSTLNFINKGSNQVVFGGLPYQGLYTSVVPNERLTWERTTTYNIGFDATLWKGLLGVEFDAFCNYTTDILAANSGFPPSMGGYYETYVNNNKVEAKGLEVALSHENTVGEFKYGARFNLSWARDRWLRYKEDPNIPDYMKRTGKSTSAKLIMVSSGLFQSEEEINNSPYIMGSRPRPGDIKYVDINGDGVITHQQDRMWAGRNTMPELMGGLSLYGSWKGLDFNVLFTGAAICDVAITGAYMTPGGNVVEDNTVFTLPFKGRSNSPRYLVEGAWTPENPNADYPRLSIEAPNTNNAYSSTFWSMDGKYLRLKSAQIGYTFPTHWMKKIGVDNLRVFVEGSNLFTLTGLPEGMDPERPGVSNGYYPQQRTFMGGLTITF